MTILVKDFGIIICYIYYYLRISSIKITKSRMLFSLMFSVICSAIISFPDKQDNMIVIPAIYILVSIYLICITKSDRRFSIVISLISYAISYVIFSAAVLIMTVLVILLSLDRYYLLNQCIVLLLHMLLMVVPFLIKRTSKGMPFLSNRLFAIPGIMISMGILVTALLVNGAKFNIEYVLWYCILFILSILIFVYWRTSITRAYLERLSNRNIASLNDELMQKDEYIKKLEADVERLGKIVHRDNKLIPAMEMAVERFIMDESGEMSVGSELLDELRKMSKDRKGLVAASVNTVEPSVNTGVAKIDTLITYMSEKAANAGVTLKVTVGIDIKEMLDKCIDEESFCTLLADLLDNAIIATKFNQSREILLDMSMIKKAPSIHIFDSGLPFDKEVLRNYGIEKITTHVEDGGSGIGLMQTYEILAKFRASIFIDEFSSGLYTKKVSVVFDRKKQFLIYTPRKDDEILFLKARADLIVVRK